jgi:hypothetical protein
MTKKEANQLYAEALAWQPAQQGQGQGQSLIQKLMATKPKPVG